MFLLIFESIGTSELILIGIIALIFLGPRKMPEIARKMGKIMADFRNTTNEFKQTWEREVNFDEEAKALKDLTNLDADTEPRVRPSHESAVAALPEVIEIDASTFNDRDEELAAELPQPAQLDDATARAELPESANDKKNWL